MFIARDKDGSLRMFLDEPYKDTDRYRSEGAGCKLLNELFPNVNFENSPIEVELVSKTILFKYKDIEEAAKKRYPEDVWKRVAFKNGAMWTIEHLSPEKNREDIFDEMEIPRITLD